MLIDLHAHSKAISKCSRIKGIDNIELAKRYIQEYYDLKEYGDKHNFKVYFASNE